MIRQQPDGRFQVRSEFSMIVFDERSAARLDQLCNQAHLEVRKRFEVGARACPGIREGLPEFLSYQRAQRGNTERTMERYRRRLLRWAEDLGGDRGDIRPTEISREQVQAWLDKRLKEPGRKGKYIDIKTVSREYVNGDLAVLKRFGQWCYEQGFCGPDLAILAVPALRVPGKVKGRYKPRAIQPERFREILDAVKQVSRHVHLILEAMLLYGARPEALFALEQRMVELPRSDGGDGVVRIPAVKSGLSSDVRIPKGSRRHIILLEARELWHRWHGRYPRAGEPIFCTRWGNSRVRPYGWTTSAYDRMLARALKKAGIEERFTAYVARHSAISWLLSRGYKQVQVQHYAKHLQISTQEIYHWSLGTEAQSAYDEMEAILDE